MRDNQRQRVYNAERDTPMWSNSPRIDDIDALRKYVSKICKSAWYRKRAARNAGKAFRWREIEVGDGRRRRNACGNRWQGYIKMPVWSRNVLVILHEVAHVCQPDVSAGHGREYCKIYLALVKKWMGRVEYELLKIAFKKHGVKYVTGNVKV
jgi:putative metallohydrolase (TIGR04338 family)